MSCNRKLSTENRLGQTAMEYLLLLVVIIAVIIALMMFMQGSSTAQKNQTTCNMNRYLCSLEICASDQNCTSGSALEVCGPGATCDDMGKCVAGC